LGAACVRVPVVRVVVAVAVAVDVRVLLLRMRAIGWKPAATASNVNHANSIVTIADVAIVPSDHAEEPGGMAVTGRMQKVDCPHGQIRYD
jgi:hypothetical protein